MTPRQARPSKRIHVPKSRRYRPVKSIGSDQLLGNDLVGCCVRRFSAEYLEQARRGLWTDRDALADLNLSDRDRILDVGCGTGELTAVLREDSAATIVGIDAERSLLEHTSADYRVGGDAMQLPFSDNSFDLVICQALLVNLPAPSVAIEEFVRVASDTVAAIEPDNSKVTVESTVDTEAELSRRAREAFIEGITTDVTLGDVSGAFEQAGLSSITSTEHVHLKRIDSPYSETEIESAIRKVNGTRIAEKRETLLAGGFTEDTYEAFLRDWQAMGRDVIDAMQAGTYKRTERVPYYLTVGQV